MNTKPTLYSGPLSMFGMKAQIAALEKGLDVDLILVPYSDEKGYFPKHEVVARVNPKQQVPVLIHDGLELFDSTQIFEYLEDIEPVKNLWPQNTQIRAKARQLELLADEVYFPNVVELMFLQDNLNSDKAKNAIEQCHQFCLKMEQRLNSNDFFFEEISFADIGFFMTQLFGERMGAKLDESTPNLIQWRNRMIQRKTVQVGIQPLVDFLYSVNRPIPPFISFLIKT